MRDGGKCVWSVNRVLLTGGLIRPGGQNVGIPPEYIVDIVDRFTGDSVVALPTPFVASDGSVPGGSVVAEAVISREGADRIQRHVAFTIAEEEEDVRQIVWSRHLEDHDSA